MKILPGIYQLINGEVSIAKLRNVEIEDLLGRDPIRVNLDEIMGYVSGKVVLVTGEAAPSEASCAARWRATTPSS